MIALVYRVGKGCRQYPFESIDELSRWAGKHPYKNEQLRVMPVVDGRILNDRVVAASKAAEFVRSSI